MSKAMYKWRHMTAEERQQALDKRKSLHVPGTRRRTVSVRGST